MYFKESKKWNVYFVLITQVIILTTILLECLSPLATPPIRGSTCALSLSSKGNSIFPPPLLALTQRVARGIPSHYSSNRLTMGGHTISALRAAAGCKLQRWLCCPITKPRLKVSGIPGSSSPCPNSPHHAQTLPWKYNNLICTIQCRCRQRCCCCCCSHSRLTPTAASGTRIFYELSFLVLFFSSFSFLFIIPRSAKLYPSHCRKTYEEPRCVCVIFALPGLANGSRIQCQLSEVDAKTIIVNLICIN